MNKKNKIISIGILLALFLVTILFGLIVLYQTKPLEDKGNATTLESAKVINIDQTDTSMVNIVILSGEDKDRTAMIQIPLQAQSVLNAGDNIKVFKLDTSKEGDQSEVKDLTKSRAAITKSSNFQNSDTSTLSYGFLDFDRSGQTIVILIIWAILIIAIARLKGIASIFGLVISVLVVLFFTIPAITSGADPILTGFVTSSAIMFLVQFFAHGFNMKTVTALLGTIFGLLISTGVGYILVITMKIYTISDESASFLIYDNANNIGLYSLVICSMIVSSVGALNDTTVTQASSVKELSSLDNTLTRLDLYKRAMKIGRDHIASTIYTVTLVYISTLLPTIMMLQNMHMNFWDSLNSYQIVPELISILASSIGLIIAVPLTTLIAAITHSNVHLDLVENKNVENSKDSIEDIDSKNL